MSDINRTQNLISIALTIAKDFRAFDVRECLHIKLRVVCFCDIRNWLISHFSNLHRDWQCGWHHSHYQSRWRWERLMLVTSWHYQKSHVVCFVKKLTNRSWLRSNIIALPIAIDIRGVHVSHELTLLPKIACCVFSDMSRLVDSWTRSGLRSNIIALPITMEIRGFDVRLEDLMLVTSGQLEMLV